MNPDRNTITLRGGPFDGHTAPAPTGRSLLIDMDTGVVARYRQSRQVGVFTFREYDRIVGRVKRS